MQHVWQVDEDGDVDQGAVEAEAEGIGHNGPRCTVCGFMFCVHCHPEWWQSDCPGPDAPLGWQPPRTLRGNLTDERSPE